VMRIAVRIAIRVSAIASAVAARRRTLTGRSRLPDCGMGNGKTRRSGSSSVAGRC
jgi:hypothetical protein